MSSLVNPPWIVIETECRPAKYKVYPTHTYRNTNQHFFKDRKKAKEFASFMNKMWKEEQVQNKYSS